MGRTLIKILFYQVWWEYNQHVDTLANKVFAYKSRWIREKRRVHPTQFLNNPMLTMGWTLIKILFYQVYWEYNQQADTLANKVFPYKSKHIRKKRRVDPTQFLNNPMLQWGGHLLISCFIKFGERIINTLILWLTKYLLTSLGALGKKEWWIAPNSLTIECYNREDTY